MPKIKTPSARSCIVLSMDYKTKTTLTVYQRSVRGAIGLNVD